MKQSTIDNDPETCVKFVRALMYALEAVQEDRELAARILEKEFATLTEEGRAAALERAYEDQLWSVDGVISRQAVDTLMDVLLTTGLYEDDYTYEELVDMRFVDQVATEKAE